MCTLANEFMSPVAFRRDISKLNNEMFLFCLFPPQTITTSTQFPFTYGQQLSYWYPQSYPSTAAATAAAQLQGQYLQGVQGYPYGQFGYQQGYVG